MRLAKQLGFHILDARNARYGGGTRIFGGDAKRFGGSLLKNSNAKTKRPLATKRSMHLVLRSSVAKGPKSFLRRSRAVEAIINRQARIHSVRIYKLANAGNHLHLVVTPSSRIAYNRFIRSVAGLIARLVRNKQRGASKAINAIRAGKIKFWDKRPFTRIVEWGREFRDVLGYLRKNTLEAMGFLSHAERDLAAHARKIREAFQDSG
jgi:REP element-mobilizing transposase RayT